VKKKVEREEGEEKSESWQEEVTSMTGGRRRSLGRPNLPWRLDGKPPTAM
jgi:hypothetical protein